MHINLKTVSVVICCFDNLKINFSNVQVLVVVVEGGEEGRSDPKSTKCGPSLYIAILLLPLFPLHCLTFEFSWLRIRIFSSSL